MLMRMDMIIVDALWKEYSVKSKIELNWSNLIQARNEYYVHVIIELKTLVSPSQFCSIFGDG